MSDKPLPRPSLLTTNIQDIDFPNSQMSSLETNKSYDREIKHTKKQDIAPSRYAVLKLQQEQSLKQLQDLFHRLQLLENTSNCTITPSPSKQTAPVQATANSTANNKQVKKQINKQCSKRNEPIHRVAPESVCLTTHTTLVQETNLSGPCSKIIAELPFDQRAKETACNTVCYYFYSSYSSTVSCSPFDTKKAKNNNTNKNKSSEKGTSTAPAPESARNLSNNSNNNTTNTTSINTTINNNNNNNTNNNNTTSNTRQPISSVTQECFSGGNNIEYWLLTSCSSYGSAQSLETDGTQQITLTHATQDTAQSFAPKQVTKSSQRLVKLSALPKEYRVSTNVLPRVAPVEYAAMPSVLEASREIISEPPEETGLDSPSVPSVPSVDRRELEALQETVQMLTSESLDKSNQLEELALQLGHTKNALHTETHLVAELRTQLDSHAKEAQTLQTTIQTLEDQSSNYKKSSEDAAAQNDRLAEDIERTKQSLLDTETEKTNLAQTCRTWENTHATLLKEKTAVDVTNVDLGRTVKGLDAVLEDTRKQLIKEKADRLLLMKDFLALTNDHKQLGSNFADLQHELETVMEDKHNLECNLQQMQENQDAMLSEIMELDVSLGISVISQEFSAQKWSDWKEKTAQLRFEFAKMKAETATAQLERAARARKSNKDHESMIWSFCGLVALLLGVILFQYYYGLMQEVTYVVSGGNK
eukprot:TRINITY_DN2846_c0_g5_i1.p1 TRINITY_DN2846_c0_g5~~TRINITY_DN2846_c0_g5_i1.p1  ORF type:complete len:703 (+),score=102.61 TRINITY_DN2846_c0_g5_i1:41-2149(+)